MIKGTPAYTHFGTLTPNQNKSSKRYLKFRGKADWVEAAALDKADEKIWGEDKWDFSGRTDITDIKFELEYKVDAKNMTSAYGELNSDFIEFGVRVWNKATRTRKWFKGAFTINTTGKLEARFDSAAALPIALAQFSGEIEIQPLIVSKTPLRDSVSGLRTQPGTILGWSDPIVIELQKNRKGLSALFEIRWKAFSEEAGLDGAFFEIDWSERPIIYLNDANQALKQVLMSEASRGKVARVRDAINRLIAHQAVTTGLMAAFYQFKEIHSNGALEASDIIENLSSQNESILREWGWMLTQHGDATRVDDIAQELLEILENGVDLGAVIVDELSIRVQREFGTEKSIDDLISEVSDGDATDD